MGQNIVYLHGRPEPIGHFLRIGRTGHRQLETLLNSGKMMINRVVVDAAFVTRQSELMASIADSGGELILDTNIAELSSVGKFSGAYKSAPWANPESVLTPDDLRPNANRDIIGQVARFAVEHGFHSVHSPSHMLDGSTDSLFNIDREAVVSLRSALDAAGGRHININYQMFIKMSSLRDPVQRKVLLEKLKDLPFDNLWFRVCGFGVGASPVAIRHYISSVLDFIALDRPIVADGVAGLAGLAVAAFGAAGGICHGVMENERFDSSNWHKPPQKGGSFGKEKRILVEAMDRFLTEKQLNELINVPGARRVLSCGDTLCCPHGFEDTLRDSKAHYLRQRALGVLELSQVPEIHRIQHYMEKMLTPVERASRSIAKLRVSDQGIKKILEKNSQRLEKMHSVLDDLNATLVGHPRSRSPQPYWGGESETAFRKR